MLTKWKDEGSNHEPPHKYNYNTQVPYKYFGGDGTFQDKNINVAIDL